MEEESRACAVKKRDTNEVLAVIYGSVVADHQTVHGGTGTARRERRWVFEEEESSSCIIDGTHKQQFSRNVHCPRSLEPITCLKVGVGAPPSARAQVVGEKTKEVIEDEGKFLVGTYARAPVVLERGKGCKVYDVEGNEYLDLSGGIAMNALGHGDADWLKAVVDQAATLTHVSKNYHSIP